MHTNRATECQVSAGPTGKPALVIRAPEPEVGRIPIDDYLRIAHPRCVLLSRTALRWMLFTLFVAGLCCGLILGKHLA